jgi:hypothetical protein
MYIIAAVGDGWLAVAAVITAIGGIISSIAAAKRAKKEGIEESNAKCHERLVKMQEESERLAAELHRMKMIHYDETEYE